MKIIVLDGNTANPGDLSWEGFERLGELRVYPRIPENGKASIICAIRDAEAVITNKVPITDDVLEACPSIKYIGVTATGYNVVDLDAAKTKGIPVTNIPAYSTDTVAQHVFALLLEICHHVGYHDAAVKNGAWTRSEDFCFWDYPLIELRGKTMGLVGFGRIGQKVAEIAKTFGMGVLAYSPGKSAMGSGNAEYAELDELYARADIVSLHCPLTEGNKGMIDKNAIAKMKDGVIIINAARGPLVNEWDLSDALNSGKVYAAGIDVASVEPISEDDPLLTAKNCFITPHIAWASKESRQRLIDIAVNNLKAFLDGDPVNVVNK